MTEESHAADITIVHKTVIVKMPMELTILALRGIIHHLEKMFRQGYTTYIVDFTRHRSGFNMTVLSMLTYLAAKLIRCQGTLLFSAFPEQDILSMLHLTGRFPVYDSLDKALDQYGPSEIGLKKGSNQS